MAALDDTSPLLGDPRIPDAQRLNRPLIYGLILVLGLGTFVLAVLGVSRMMAPPTPPPLVVNETPAMTTPVPPLEPYIKVPVTFAGLDRRPPLPVAEVLPPPPTAPLPPPPVAQTEAPAPPPPPRATAAETKPPQAPPAKTEPVKATPPPTTERKEDTEWLFADMKSSPRKRQGPGAEPGQGGHSPSGHGSQSALFPAAAWERPARPERVIYASQMLNGMLEQAIQTGHDGTIRVRLTETLYDKFGQLETLLPVHSLILGKVEGANVKAGQTTVPITVTKVELPDGTDLPLAGNMGSADGIAGVPGKVDNRYPQVVLAAVLTAATSIGARSMTGSPSGFQPNLGQEFTADAAQSLSHSGQKIVERSLSIDPIITIAPQTPVTIQLERNISLQSEPRIVHR